MALVVAAVNIYAGDAVGNHCFGIARLASRLGVACRMFAQGFKRDTKQVGPIEDLFTSITSDDTLLVIHSIFDSNLDRLLQLTNRKICYFHGITPPELVGGFDGELAALCRRGIAQTLMFGKFDRIVTNSRLIARGLRNIVDVDCLHIVPPVFSDMSAFRQAPSTRVLDSKILKLLSVGRVVPHKRIEDSITFLRSLVDSGQQAKLMIVGGLVSIDYQASLIRHVRELDLLESVTFAGTLSSTDLYDVFKSSDVVMTTSVHEGFCVPILEALHFGCHILVRSGTAAEELAVENEVFKFPVISVDLESTIASCHFRRRSDDLEGGKKALRAAKVLAQASDEVWDDILRLKRND